MASKRGIFCSDIIQAVFCGTLIIIELRRKVEYLLLFEE